MPGYLAWIIPVTDPSQPPGIWGPGGPWPTPPIANVPGVPPSGNPPGFPGNNPPGIWGGANQPFPTPPIANVPGIPNPNPPGFGTGIWGGANQPFPTPPIANVPGIPNPNPPGWGLHPAHPIVIPDPPIDVPPPGGGETGSISNPINRPPSDPAGESGYWAQAFFPGVGWAWVWVPVGPSK